ncbi:RelA/SpoT family protein [Candidatus Peregrinibacteria bacterium]|nr:RelA/SpoT family protein [Candidatus Peregrinibacteria bacterium]
MTPINYQKYFDLEDIIKDIKVYLPKFDRKNFVKAFDFAERAHRSQIRKDGITPYIVHPVSVVQILSKLRADEDILVSALLHDVPEDTDHTIKDVKETFGETVAFLVDGITKLSRVQYQKTMSASKIETLKKLFIHSAKDPRVIIIKLADRLHNMNTLEFVAEEKQLRIAKETLEIFVPIANLLGIHELKSQLEDLCFKYLYPKQFKEIKERLEEHNKAQKKVTIRTKSSIKKLLNKHNIDATVQERRRRLYNIYKKLKAVGKTAAHLDDRIWINIVVNTTEECYTVLGLVHGRFIPKTNRFKDYIANPKINGYKSLHTGVFGIDGVLTEIHICTKQMRLEADYGIASSFFTNKYLISGDEKSSWLNKAVAINDTNRASEYLENLKSDILEDRIFVFTPKGATIDLPKGASAIDFAYAIHTDIGHKAIKASVNGVSQAITTALNTGDVVNVLTSGDSMPEHYWLYFAKTNLAKKRIKNSLKKQSKSKKLESGEDLLQKEFDIAGLGYWKNVSFKKARQSLLDIRSREYKNWQDIFISIGSGDLKPTTVVEAISGKGTKHKSFNLEATFDEENKDLIKVSMKILARNRNGLVKDISKIAYKYSVDMTYFKGWSPPLFNYAFFSVTIVLDQHFKVSKIFEEIKQIEGVQSVHRVRYKGLILFYSGIIGSLLIWLFHSYLIKLSILAGLFSAYPVLSAAMLYLEIFFPLLTVFYLTHILKKYFPSVRAGKILWLTMFLVLTISIVNIGYKYNEIAFEKNWAIFIGGILSAYVYLFTNYFKHKKSKY